MKKGKEKTTINNSNVVLPGRWAYCEIRRATSDHERLIGSKNRPWMFVVFQIVTFHLSYVIIVMSSHLQASEILFAKCLLTAEKVVFEKSIALLFIKKIEPCNSIVIGKYLVVLSDVALFKKK